MRISCVSLGEKGYVSIEHKSLFIPIGSYFTKIHVWRVKMFHKTVHKAWNIFKCSKQLLENSVENLVSQVSIDREESSIDQTIQWL